MTVAGPIARAAMAERIAATLLDRICLLQHPPGAQLREADLAREFGVSRTPVRDALSRIAHLGLIESRNGVGTVVVELHPDQVRQIYALRLELAVLIGRLSPLPPDAGMVMALRALRDEVREQAPSSVPARYVAINHRLNLLVAGTIGNAPLHEAWLKTYQQAASTWHRVAERLGAEVWAALADELHDLILAAEAGDAQAIGHVQRIHVGYGLAKLEGIWRADGADGGFGG